MKSTRGVKISGLTSDLEAILGLALTLVCGFAREDGEFDLDLEDIMVMEAIWLSIQVCSSSTTSPLLVQKLQYQLQLLPRTSSFIIFPT